jgi:mRNA interferase RelE/StbE
MYSLVLSKRFDNEFSKLDKEIRDRVIEELEKISENPRIGKPLKGKLRGLHSVRVGTHRVIYQILDEKRTVAAVAVGHRKTVYE